MKWIYKLIIILLLILTTLVIIKKPKEILVETEIITVDTVTVEDWTNKVSISTYESMEDELTKKLRSVQNKLNIRSKDLNEALRINAELKSQGYGKVDTITYIEVDTIKVVDYIELSYSDEFTEIGVKGHVTSPDSIEFSFSTDASLSMIEHTKYKQGKYKLSRWWYRLWKVGKHDVITIESDNPALKIQDIKHIQLNK